jgi:endoglucanase
VIRTGGPSAPADAKVAIVASGHDLAGRGFSVIDADDHTVLHGTLRAAPGSARPWAHAYRADFSKIKKAGSYRVRVGGWSSRSWTVRKDPNRPALATMLRFFAANSDGREASPLHAPSHLHDATVASGPHAGEHLDLTGGWMDAGDMMHFTQTTGFATALLEAAARLDHADAAPLRRAADVGVRWLVRAHPAPDLFIAQVGDERDHQVGWRNPADDDASSKPGIGSRLAYPAVGGDLAGKAAAALAMASDRSGGATHALLLTQAREWYAAGRAAGRAAPSPGVAFYPSSTWQDDMAAGAAALYRSTRERAYLSDALAYLSSSELEGGVGWYEFAPFAAAELCGELGAPPVADAAARRQACDALVVAGTAAVRQSRSNAFATPGAFTWGQTAANGGMGALAALAGLTGRLRDGLRVAAGARDYLVGRNPWGASFVVGYGKSPARHPHHWASVFGSGKPRGAVVGGPAPLSMIEEHQGDFGPPRSSAFSTRAATYEDRREDYVTSEPALDYTAASILLAAALEHAH